MRRFLFWAGLIVVMFLLLALLPYIGTIGLVLFLMLIILAGAGLLSSLYWLYTKVAAWHLANRQQRVELEKQRIYLDYVVAEEGQRIYGVFLQPGDERTFLPLADPERLTIHQARTVVPELPPNQEQPLLGPPFPQADPFRHIWNQISWTQMVLGYRLVNGASRAILGSVVALLSTIAAGRPGTGKSSLIRLICAQLAKIGGISVVWDMHGSVTRSVKGLPALGTRLADPEQRYKLLFPCKDSAQVVQSALDLIALLENRLKEYDAGRSVWQPVLLLADEWPLIYYTLSKLKLETGENAGEVVFEALRRVVLEGRKVYLFGFVSGQGLNAKLLGGDTLVKHAMATHYAFRTEPLQAQLVGIEAADFKPFLARCEKVFGEAVGMIDKDPSAGLCVLKSNALGATIAALPYVSEEDFAWAVNEAYTYFSTHYLDFYRQFGELEEAIVQGEDDPYRPAVEAINSLFPDRKRGETQETALAKRGNDFEGLPTLPELPRKQGIQAPPVSEWKQREHDLPPLKEPLLSVSLRFPQHSRALLEQIYLHYIHYHTPRRDLAEALGRKGSGGRFYQEVLNPVCDAIDEAIAAMTAKGE